MRTHDGENIRPKRPRGSRGWVAYMPDEPDDAERHRRLDEEIARHREAQERARAVLATQHADFFEAKARVLLDHGHVSIRASSGQVDAMLLRFGENAVLETRGTAGDQRSHGMQRIEADQLRDALPLLSGWLQQAVLHLGNQPGSLR